MLNDCNTQHTLKLLGTVMLCSESSEIYEVESVLAADVFSLGIITTVCYSKLSPRYVTQNYHYGMLLRIISTVFYSELSAQYVTQNYHHSIHVTQNYHHSMLFRIVTTVGMKLKMLPGIMTCCVTLHKLFWGTGCSAEHRKEIQYLVLSRLHKGIWFAKFNVVW